MIRSASGARACGAAMLLLAPALALADDFSEFRIPKNRSLLWTAGLGMQIGRAHV